MQRLLLALLLLGLGSGCGLTGEYAGAGAPVRGALGNFSLRELERFEGSPSGVLELHDLRTGRRWLIFRRGETLLALP